MRAGYQTSVTHIANQVTGLKVLADLDGQFGLMPIAAEDSKSVVDEHRIAAHNQLIG
jgi:hypothetical protein